MSSVEHWLKGLSSAEWVFLAFAAIVLLNFFLRGTRRIARRPRLSHLVWLSSQPRPLGAPRRKLRGGPRHRPGEWLGRRLARIVVWYAGQPLLVKAFEGAKDDDTAAISSALSSAMTRIASLRRSGVDSVTAPIGAETTTEAVADGVKATPAGGELAAALVRLSAVVLARGATQLSGHVLPPSLGGPGLALTLAKGNGTVIERLTIRATEFEPPLAAGETRGGDETDRMLRVATAGAVWTHFKILEEVWRLTDGELEKNLRTWSWRSYALMRIGIEGEGHHSDEETRALYAKAVEVDSGNLAAQFNLASAELKDELFPRVRTAGAARLALVHDKLHDEYERAKAEKGGGARVKLEQLLLGRDPLCYQVSYKRVAAKLNDDVASEAKRERDRNGVTPDAPAVPVHPAWQWWWRRAADGKSWEMRRAEGMSLTGEDLSHLTEHLKDLETTLEILERKAHKGFATARLKQRIELRRLLKELEGPMLVLWAMVALRVKPLATGSPWPPEALADPKYPSAKIAQGSKSRRGTRKWLIGEVGSGALTPGEAVGFARAVEVSPSSRTRLNLACWYADVGELPASLCELELGMEYSAELAGGWLRDEQLRRVRGVYCEEWKKLESRYLNPPRSVPENGDRRSRLSPALLVSLISDRRGG